MEQVQNSRTGYGHEFQGLCVSEADSPSNVWVLVTSFIAVVLHYLANSLHLEYLRATSPILSAHGLLNTVMLDIWVTWKCLELIMLFFSISWLYKWKEFVRAICSQCINVPDFPCVALRKFIQLLGVLLQIPIGKL